MMQYYGEPQPPLTSMPVRKRRRWPWVVLSLGIILLLLCMGLSGYWLMAFQSFRMTGPSMQPALPAGEDVSVNKLAYLFSKPSRGDVIVFHYPADPTQEFIKRVIGIPGDTVKVTQDQIWIDGVLLHEPYITQPVNPQPITLTLSANQYFVAGDNRPFSSDSRSWGPVPLEYIIGRAEWAFGSGGLHSIPTYPDTFSALK